MDDHFEADAPPQFFAATDEELKAAFPMWQPLLPEPVERWFENPFTKERMFGKTRVPEHRPSQPESWLPVLTHLPRSKRVPLDRATLGEFFDRLVDHRDDEIDDVDEDYDALHERPRKHVLCAIRTIAHGTWTASSLVGSKLSSARRPAHVTSMRASCVS